MPQEYSLVTLAMPTETTPSIDQIRAQFPSLANGEIFMDNAGGAQVPLSVADAIRDYLLNSNVQIGAEYPASRRATQSLADAHSMMNTVMGGDGIGQTILGASSSVLCQMLADCYADSLQPGDEVIVAESGHEANVGPWVNLAKRGITVKLWEANPTTGICELATLQNLLSAKTKVVALVHVSNILGQVEDIKPCIDAAHAVGAKVVVDGVAYAPHLTVDVAGLDADWYVFSCYKVFGPHIGAMFGKHDAFAELTGPNHYFLPKSYLPAKFELGSPCYESCAGLLGLKPYLQFLAGESTFDRSTVLAAWRAMEELEQPLTARLLDFLATKPKVKVIGSAAPGKDRVPTISFLHENRTTQEISDAVLQAGIGMRWGNFYSVRLLERLGINSDSGVARVSFAHYNTVEEVDRLISALEPVL